MRLPTACIACRTRRRRCEIPASGQACTYCSARRIECVGGTYVASSVPTTPNQIAASSAPTLAQLEEHDRAKASSATSIPSQALCMELVHLYFDFVHDQFHSLFHRPSLEEDVLNGTAPAVLLYGIMALSARFSTNPAFAGIDRKDRSKGYARECGHLLDLQDVSLTTIQACVLLGTISITEGKSAAESVYYSVAVRIALLLDLANRQPVDILEEELNRRVWWTLYMIDTWSSFGVRLPKLMPHLDSLPLPIDDGKFLQMRRGSSPSPQFILTPPKSESSLVAQMIKLNYILTEINELNRLTAANSGTVFEEKIERLSQDLDNWYRKLPHNMHDTPENLAFWASQGMGRTFVAVYLGYYHFGQLLFYQFLHVDSHTSVTNAHSYALKCKAHSMHLCDITYAAHSTPNCDVLYTMVGHVLVIASTVQIHTLLFAESDDQIRAARERLERNFEILTKLRGYWPTLEASFSRLRAFHKACQNLIHTSFRLDHWMLGFLTEFAKPMDDKRLDSQEPEWLVDNLGISPHSQS